MRTRQRILIQRAAAIVAAAVGLIVIALPILLDQAASARTHENSSVWRAQIRIVTGDVGDAGTDDSVSVSLASGNLTWLDYARDDFERGDDFTYDLLLEDIHTIGNISHLRLSKTGSNGWCVGSVLLLINDWRIFDYQFQRGSTRCQWLDNSGGHSNAVTLPGVVMRTHGFWRSYEVRQSPTVITRPVIESRIEAAVGHHMTATGKNLKWGKLHGRPVEVTRKDDVTLHVDLDLKYPVAAWPDLEVDVDFDMRLQCGATSMGYGTPAGGATSLRVPVSERS